MTTILLLHGVFLTSLSLPVVFSAMFSPKRGAHAATVLTFAVGVTLIVASLVVK